MVIGLWEITGSTAPYPASQNPGNYYIKAVDGAVGSSVAVTDTYLTIPVTVYNSVLSVSPSSGPGGTSITFTGSGWPSSSTVVISYMDPNYGWKQLTTTKANLQGQISVLSEAPDLMRSIGTYDSYETYTSISYKAETVGGLASSSVATFNEYHRGLTSVGTAIANGLFGNGTDLTSSVRMREGDTITISGKWFHSGSPIYIRWDGEDVVGTVTSAQWLQANIIGQSAANSYGSFNATATIPTANAGQHYLAVEDSQTRIIVKVCVVLGYLNISPSSGPGGATVEFSGSLFPASSTVDLYYYDSSWARWNYWTSTTSTSSGTIQFSTEIPDLKQSSYAGDYSNYSSGINFRTDVNNVSYAYADYNQYARGLTQVSGQVAYTLFGNGTYLASNVNVKPGDSLFISGKYFHPGIVYVKFDGVAATGSYVAQQWSSSINVGSTTANQQGSFEITVTVPTVDGGQHSIAIEDSQTTLVVSIKVTAPTATPTPAPTTSPTTSPTTHPPPPPSLPTPTIDLTCKGTTTSSGAKVQINGELSLNGNAIAESPVLISYSITGGDTWKSLTTVNTQSDGSFAAVWYPDVTGNYKVKASSEATSSMNAASKTINLALTPGSNENNVFTVNSNSTITQFAFDSASNQLSFVASGESHTTGYVEIYIPKTLLSDITQLTATIDNKQVDFDSISQGDSWLITFTYSHSSHTITMTIGQSGGISNNDNNMQTLMYILPIVVIAILAVVVVALLKRRK